MGECNERKFRYASKIASILAPEFVDENENEIDDRGEKLGEMLVNSGETYQWGWQSAGAANSFWWGWQSAGEGNPFWWSWQTVELTTKSEE